MPIMCVHTKKGAFRKELRYHIWRQSPHNLAKPCRSSSDNTSKGKAPNNSTKWEKNSRKAPWPRQGRRWDACRLPDVKLGEAVTGWLIKEQSHLPRQVLLGASGDVAAGPWDGNPAHRLEDVSRGQQEQEEKKDWTGAAEFRFNFRALV